MSFACRTNQSEDESSAAIARLVRQAYVEASQSPETRAQAFEAALRVYQEHNAGTPARAAGMAVAEILTTCDDALRVG